MIGTFCGIIFFIAYLPYTECQRYHEFGMIESCSGSAGANEVLYIYENELAGYMDIEEAKLVVTVPDIMYSIFDFDKFKFDKFFDIDPAHTGSTSLCKETYFRILSLNISEPLEPPWTSIYSRNDVKLHVNNTLICLVSGFYPPPVRVSWTKNNVDVTDRSTVSRYYPNNDMTLNVFSRLSFIPEEGDIYSCSVEHKALQQPQTRTWDVEIKELSIGPSVFCGVGLTLGLLGLATGVFFIAKEKKWI